MESIQSKITTVKHYILSLIKNQRLLHGDKLPSIRSLASQLDVSTSTVVEAYERLVVEDVIHPRAGSGYYVTGTQPSYIANAVQIDLERDVDPLWISRQSLEADKHTLKPGCGWLPASWMPLNIIKKSIREATQSDDGELVDYPQPQGYLPLRNLVARRMCITEIEVSAEQVILTESSTHALDLLFRLFLNTNDCVLIDDPCYFNFHALLKIHDVIIVSVPYTSSGPDVEQFQQLVEKWKPKFYITNSGLHNPTGAVLSLPTAYQILKTAEQHQVKIIEDDVFSDFENTIAPSYASLGGTNAVIRVGSYSKSISAAIRCGYIVANMELIDLLINLKISTSFSGNFFNAKVVYHTLTSSQYRKHLDGLKAKLSQRMTTTIQRLAELQIRPWLVPSGGMFLWCELDHSINTTELSKACLKHDVILAPGNAFSQSNYAAHFLRFNVAQASDPKIYSVLAQQIKALSR